MSGVCGIERERERERCVLFEFRHFLTLRTRLRISKFHVYLCKKLFLSIILHYKRHLRRWRARESVFFFF